MSPRPIESERPDLEPALQLAREGRHADAIDWLFAAMRSESVSADGLHQMVQVCARIARAAAESGDVETSERALREALRLRPAFADLHLQLALTLLLRQRRPEARKALEAALRLHPRYLAARVELALLDASEGRIGEALASLRDVEQDSRIDEPLAFAQGLKSLEHADWDGARPLFRRAVRVVDPQLDRAIERFHACLEDGAIERAAQALRDVLPEYESYPDLHAMLGAAELRLGAYDDALASLARALELNPNYHEARLQFARALDALGQRGQAAEQVQMVLQCDPDQAAARELLENWSARGRRFATRENPARKAS